MFEKMKKLLDNIVNQWDKFEYEIKEEHNNIIIEANEYSSSRMVIKCPKKAFDDEKVFVVLYDIVKEFGHNKGNIVESKKIFNDNKTLLDDNNVNINFLKN